MKKRLKFIGISILSTIVIIIVFIMLLIIYRKPEGISYSILLSIKDDMYSYDGILLDVVRKEDDNIVNDKIVYNVMDSFDFMTDDKKRANSGSADLWINKEEVQMISVLFDAAPVPCCDTGDTGIFPANINSQDLKILINGKKLSSTLNERKQRRTEIKYDGTDEETYIMDVSWRNGFNLKSSVYLHWLESGEFEKLKVEKLKEFENLKSNEMHLKKRL